MRYVGSKTVELFYFGETFNSSSVVSRYIYIVTARNLKFYFRTISRTLIRFPMFNL